MSAFLVGSSACGTVPDLLVVDRVEQGIPVVLDGQGQVVQVPVPVDVVEGTVLVDGKPDPSEARRRSEAIAARRRKLAASDDGKDFSLVSRGP